LAKIGCPIKGDLKYGFDRSNKDGGISLHARQIQLHHPVKDEEINLIAPLPDEPQWKIFDK
jgi:23S rRNA pseudouridine1911/1915/1917 synthase